MDGTLPHHHHHTTSARKMDPPEIKPAFVVRQNVSQNPNTASPTNHQGRVRSSMSLWSMVKYGLGGLLVLACCNKQFRRPLEQYTGMELSFKTPIYFRGPTQDELKRQEHAMQFGAEDTELWLQEDPYESHDSHDALPNIAYASSQAMKVLQDYQYHHSHHQLSEEFNTKCQEQLPCKALTEHRRFLYVSINCVTPLSDHTMIWQVLKSMTYAMITDRTLLLDDQGTCSSNNSGEQKQQQEQQQQQWIQSWIPQFSVWQSILFPQAGGGNVVPTMTMISADDITQLEYHHRHLEENTIVLEQHSKDIMLAQLSEPAPALKETQAWKSESSRQTLEAFLTEWDNMMDGILLDHLFVYPKPQDIGRKEKTLIQDQQSETSPDSEDSNDHVHRFVVLKQQQQENPNQVFSSTKEWGDTAECVSELVTDQMPCIIYTVGVATEEEDNNQQKKDDLVSHALDPSQHDCLVVPLHPITIITSQQQNLQNQNQQQQPTTTIPEMLQFFSHVAKVRDGMGLFLLPKQPKQDNSNTAASSSNSVLVKVWSRWLMEWLYHRGRMEQRDFDMPICSSAK